MEIEEAKKEKKPPVPFEVRLEIIHLKKNGLSDEEVSRRVGYPKSTCNYIYNKFLKTGAVENLKKPGKPRQVTEKEERMLLETVEDRPDLSLNGLIGEVQAPFGKTKAYTILREYGFRSYTTPEKWALTPEHRTLRLQWAMKFRKKSNSFWKRVLFTDESIVKSNPHKQKLWATDRSSLPLIEKDRWEASILCWGVISFEGKSILECIPGTMKADTYLKMLKNRLLKNFPGLGSYTKKGANLDNEERLIFQQDGASVHTADDVLDYFQEKGIEVIEWPPKSPDINLMESVWSELKSKLKRAYQNKEELIEDIYNSWDSIPLCYIQNLYNSMEDRVLAIIEAEGGPTRY